ncbi:PAS domain-containing sensor histidine kinase [Bacillus sp. REN3]|uniref:PAS domain-containing sensor histidine kinase n=1 Tax=Bacillus sp. REN3 TaxID=2802440 RepID=UPI001AEDAAF7|nr:PAS domain-containing sensor histidine kinase [Bacillus sp. REN3]
MEILLNDSPFYKNVFMKLSYPVMIIEVLNAKKDQYRFYDVNDAACSLLKYSRDELMDRNAGFLFDRIGAGVRSKIKNLLVKKGEISSILDLPDADNQMVTVEMNASLIREGEKLLVFCLLKLQKEPCCHQDQLKEENAHLYKIINTIQSVVIILNKEGYVFYWNQFTECLTGYTLQEVQNIKFWDLFIEPEEKKMIINNYLSGKIPTDYENYWIMKNGEKRFLKWKSTVVTDQNGESLYVIATGVDITDQVRSMNALERSKEKYKTLVSSMDDLVFTIDSSLAIKSVYGRWLEINGFTKEIFEGKSVGDVFPSSLLQTQQCKKALAGYSTDFEWQFVFNGKKHYFHSILSPIVLKNNEIKEIVGVTRDITDQKILEEHHNRIYEAVTSGIIVQDHTGRIVSANQNACSILGYSEEKLINMSSMNKEWDALNSSGERLHGEEHPAMKTLRTGEEHHNVEMAVFNPEKSGKRWILVDTTPIYALDGSGKIDYVLSTFHDITEKKEMDHLLKESEKLAVIGQLASGVAHEIRNPLTGIIGFMKLLDENPDAEKLHEYLPVIRKELDQINQITEEFIELSDSKKDGWAVTRLSEIVKEALAFLESDIAINNIQKSLECREEVMVQGIEVQLKQLFIHLFKNSIEAMPHGGGLNIKAQKDKDMVIIYVTDNGKGMSPERLKHLGEPFYSLREKGTGLGLMRCRKIVHDHGGTISFNSKIGKGTTVTIKLPLGNEPS